MRKKKVEESAKGSLRKSPMVRRIADVRSIVVKQAKSKRMTAYRIARLTGITEPTVRNFLDGTHEMRSDKLALVMEVLGLEIRPKE